MDRHCSRHVLHLTYGRNPQHQDRQGSQHLFDRTGGLIAKVSVHQDPKEISLHFAVIDFATAQNAEAVTETCLRIDRLGNPKRRKEDKSARNSNDS